MEAHGLASFIVHPDYLIEARARDTYKSLLAFLENLRSEGKVWLALPREVNEWWRARSQMKLVCQGNNWVIEGPQNDRARVAYAVLEGGRLAYVLDSHQASARRMVFRNGQISSSAARQPGVLTESRLIQALPLGLETKRNEQIF